MNERDPLHELPATAAELDAARHLAVTIEAGRLHDTDEESAAVAHLLEALSGSPMADARARLRLRAELVAAASPWSSRAVAWHRLAAAAAILGAAVLTVFLWRSTHPRGEGLLASREQAARSAVAAVAGGWRVDTAARQRLESVLDRAWTARLGASLDRERFSTLANGADGGAVPWGVRRLARPSLAVPIPGGVS
jgi:hypothetical protein